MLDGEMQGGAFQELFRALVELKPHIKAVHAERPDDLLSLMNLILSEASLEVSFRASPHGVEGSGPTPAGALMPAVRRAVADRDSTRDREQFKPLPQSMFQYVVLRLLTRAGGYMSKRDLLDLLPLELGLGTDVAITTRLNKMKSGDEGGLIDWEAARRNPVIEVTKAGGELLDKLVGGSKHALTPPQRKFLREAKVWFEGAA